MILANLLTKYILASIWMRILLVLLFYLAVRQLHFIESDFGIAECMPRKRAAKVIFETKEEVKQDAPLAAESKDARISQLEKQVRDLTYERTGLRNHISKLMKEKTEAEQKNGVILPLSEENQRLSTRLQEIIEQNRQLRTQIAAAEVKNKVSIPKQQLPSSGILVDGRHYASVKDYYLLQQESISKNVQKLIFGHTIDDVLSYAKKRENPTFLDYLNFFSFDSADPLEDYFYNIHEQHYETSQANVELRRDLNHGSGNYTSYLKADFEEFKNLVVRYKSNSARIQLEAFDLGSIRAYEIMDLSYKDLIGL